MSIDKEGRVEVSKTQLHDEEVKRWSKKVVGGVIRGMYVSQDRGVR